MLVLRLFRFLFGYITFVAKGGFPERFLNLCRINKINLWNLRSENHVIYACSDCAGYKKIRYAAKKSGMKVRIKSKHGLPFFLNRHSHRAGILAGICLCIAVISILSTRIWSVDVTGNVRVPAEKITGVFESLGIRKGVPAENIDIKSVEIEALRRLPEISWLNINIDGSAARIEVRETEEIKEEAESNEPSDIVASRDGQIIILRPFNGTQEQKIGNAVLKGDLLISGITENKDLTVSFGRARGYVVARTNRKISARQESKIKVRKIAEEKTDYILNFLVFTVPFGKINEGAYREKIEIVINGVTLPVSLTKCREVTYEESGVALNKNQVKMLATLNFFENCTSEFRYLKTESGKITVNQTKNVCSLDGEFVCLENIGKEIPMDIEETPLTDEE